MGGGGGGGRECAAKAIKIVTRIITRNLCLQPPIFKRSLNDVYVIQIYIT